MKRSYGTILRSFVCLALVATAAWAEEVKVENASPTDGIQTNCDLTGYKSEIRTVGASIPDNTATGVTTGPIQFTDDGLLIADVVIDLNMTHTWVGDLIATVKYDEQCDGAIDAQATVLCRPRGTAAAAPAPCGTSVGTFGCSADLSANNTMLFDDSAAAAVGDGTCVTPIAAGCYKPSSQGGSALSVFRNRHKGGCWFLTVTDNAGGDTGTINLWSVHIKNQPPIAVESTTWGNVKTIYN